MRKISISENMGYADRLSSLLYFFLKLLKKKLAIFVTFILDTKSTENLNFFDTEE